MDNAQLLARVQAHAAVRARYGYRRLHTLSAREGLVANHKRVHRVYREAGLQVRRRRRKRLTRGERVPLPAPSRPGERGSMDVIADTLAEAIGLPQILVSDNGPEFAGRTLDAWAYRRGVTLRFIRPGKPIENAYVESFNGKFRDECLNEHWFLSVAEVQTVIDAWRVDDNTVRPHRSLGQQTPAAYAAAACAGPKPGCGACSAAALATTEQPVNSDGLTLSV